MATDNHFISVSKTGVLSARRKGRAPVEVATAADGLVIEPDRAMPAPVVVFFAHGGGVNREIRVLHVTVGGERLDLDELFARYEIDAKALGRWMRAAIEAALDRAEAR